MPTKTWVDEKSFSHGDLCRLTGATRVSLQAMRLRGQFKPQYTPLQGGADRRTYTGRDVLRLLALIPSVQMNIQLPNGLHKGVNLKILEVLTKAVDSVIDKAVATGTAPDSKFVVPRRRPWCTITLDLGMLVSANLAHLSKYSKPKE